MRSSHLITTALLLTLLLMQSSNPCNLPNKAFVSGEKVSYELTYNLARIPWVRVGAVTFEVEDVSFRGKPHHKLTGIGSSYDSWDWFYKMYALHLSYIDPETLRPTYFKRHVKEPDYFIDLEYNFNWKDTVAYSKYESKKHSLRYDTIKIDPCTYDLTSILYHARNIDYSKYKVNDKIPITLLLDRELTPIYFRYLGKEDVRLRKLGKFRCLKFSVFLVEGTMFHEGERMNIWVTDDDNKIPLVIESPIRVGSVKARLVDYRGVRNKMTAKQ